ncbi:2-hydroxyacid dehydrogenase [Granulicella sp. S190]|uniref:2-hydroxyacid dehydrogenase n=1 Tax=Granulicella sp. S190 TaxID=1747226 RepID=UPI00131C602A|nr:2-hydroxyacid dehydrogenase [Granulicella sp. S190]
MRILFCGDAFPDEPDYLRRRLPPDANDELIVCPEWPVRPMLDGVDVVIPRMERVGRHEMEVGRFRLVQQWGAGLEGVDLAAARENGVRVANVPATGGNAESVAEHALLLILALLRDLPRAQANVRASILGAPIGKVLAGRTVCLYGLGAIALPLAKRLQTFGVRLIGVTRNPLSEKVSEFALDHCFSVADRDKAFAETDILVLCMRYFTEMRGTIGMHELSCLRLGAYLLNIARGGFLDEDNLYSTSKEGHLAGAGLDVFSQEPMPVGHPLLSLPNVIATPHLAGVTEESFNDIADVVAANIERLRHGQPLLNCVI